MGHSTKLETGTLVMIDLASGEEIILDEMPELEVDISHVPTATTGKPASLEINVALTKKSQRKLKRFLRCMRIKVALAMLFNK